MKMINKIWGYEKILSDDGKLPIVKEIIPIEDLSVQFHPTKTESWYILNTNSIGGFIYLGIKSDVSLDDLKYAIKCGSDIITCYLNKVYVIPGMYLEVPPMTVHMIPSGIKILEISDSNGPHDTIRLFDHHRNNRELINKEQIEKYIEKLL